ncbi:hypothetical protein F8568_003860 [Actinomadura sp. LD22]|uniref:Uncharacterized protein n=1 Tax=Actinomadura physcomitrii TaxID=2650748 RepID=A0A6I4M5V8_9ACTN|nr:hypothetical protein [Actinomadura physcomitrii]MVZ99526.1 hypothetical protein [Actinomadura physcomitrii]
MAMASAGANPEWTRPDQRLPERPPAEGAAPPPPAGTWHRMHYAVGVFLVAYGVTGLVGAALLWSDRRKELAGYFGSGNAGTLLLLAKAAEAVLVAVAAAGIVRRRDMWFVPALAGWMAGFAVFAVLDVFDARWGGLLEHLLYLAGFVVLLFVSYGLSAKAQVGSGAAVRATAASGPEGGDGDGEPRRLTRTQEFALAALNRLPHR